jgi:hypothetical protein
MADKTIPATPATNNKNKQINSSRGTIVSNTDAVVQVTSYQVPENIRSAISREIRSARVANLQK